METTHSLYHAHLNMLDFCIGPTFWSMNWWTLWLLYQYAIREIYSRLIWFSCRFINKEIKESIFKSQTRKTIYQREINRTEILLSRGLSYLKKSQPLAPLQTACFQGQRSHKMSKDNDKLFDSVLFLIQLCLS